MATQSTGTGVCGPGQPEDAIATVAATAAPHRSSANQPPSSGRSPRGELEPLERQSDLRAPIERGYLQLRVIVSTNQQTLVSAQKLINAFHQEVLINELQADVDKRK